MNQKKFKDTVVEIWEKTSERDFYNNFYINEDSMKNRLYKKITEKLGERFFLNNEIRLFTEYHIPQIGYADMALVDISPDDMNEWKVLSVIELKNKYLNDRTTLKINEDYEKLEKYLKHLNDIDTFMISINTNVDSGCMGDSWSDYFENDLEGKNIIELILDEDNDFNVKASGYDWSKKKKKII